MLLFVVWLEKLVSYGFYWDVGGGLVLICWCLKVLLELLECVGWNLWLVVVLLDVVVCLLFGCYCEMFVFCVGVCLCFIRLMDWWWCSGWIVWVVWIVCLVWIVYLVNGWIRWCWCGLGVGCFLFDLVWDWWLDLEMFVVCWLVGFWGCVGFFVWVWFVFLVRLGWISGVWCWICYLLDSWL